MTNDYPPLRPKRRALMCTKCGFSGPTEAEASPQGAPCPRCPYTAFVSTCDYSDDEMRAYVDADRAKRGEAPEGWQLVPKEPTPEMVAAMAVEEASGSIDGIKTIGMSGAALAWESALAAAPKEPT